MISLKEPLVKKKISLYFWKWYWYFDPFFLLIFNS